MIEKEALTVSLACKRLSNYLTGMYFHIETDHKLLVSLFSHKNVDELPFWVQIFRKKLIHFDYSISHVAGKLLTIVDTLTQLSLLIPNNNKIVFFHYTDLYVNMIMNHLPASNQSKTGSRKR